MKTQTKIALVFFIISLLIILITSGMVYYFIIQYSFTDFYKRLEIRAVVAARYTLEDDAAVLEEVREQYLEKLPEEKEYFFKIESKAITDSASNLLKLPRFFFDKLLEDGTVSFQNDEIFYSGIRYANSQGTYAVIVSAENYYNSHHMAYLKNILIVAIVIMSLLALYISILFSRYVFNPVKTITNGVKEISSQNLHHRLPESTANDEISELSITFNHMLDRLETSFETQNNFISNASHELSTPLTSIIGEAEVTLSKERDSNDYKETLQKILKEANRLENIVRSLLLLAQTGFDGKIQKFERVRGDQLLWDVKETIDKINPKSQIQINLTMLPDQPEKLKIWGNPRLLHLALANLVNNACKYSNNTPVILTVGTEEDKVFITVKDSGIGIPQEDIGRIFDPFFRASNTKSYEGYGIGLPLSRNIVRLHSGEISVSSTLGAGTTVKLTFPTAKIQ